MLFPTPYLRQVVRYDREDEFKDPGLVHHRIFLQQLWAPSGWQGHETLDENNQNWRPSGEWRDVPIEPEK